MTSDAVQILNKSSEIVYKLAMKPHDFRKAHAFMRAQGRESVRLSLPTMLACEDEEVIGLMSTDPRKDIILAGPMVLAAGRPTRYIALRLMEAYESLLQAMGIMTYTIFCDYASDRLMATLQKLPQTEVVGENSYGILFARRLINAAPEAH